MDYISRDELVKALKNEFDMTEQYVGAEFLELVYGMPKANVVSKSDYENCRPAKRRKWVRMYNTEDSDCACPVCYRVQARPVGRYCKWCGERMDGE